MNFYDIFIQNGNVIVRGPMNEWPPNEISYSFVGFVGCLEGLLLLAITFG